LGLAYHEKDELDNAIESYKKAINIAPKLPYAHYNLACAYSLQNEKELAIKHLKIAITQDRSCLERCQKDPDFDNIRESEGLKEIISLCDE
jgi:tetratricopeptide (TPR) repeat protein